MVRRPAGPLTAGAGLALVAILLAGCAPAPLAGRSAEESAARRFESAPNEARLYFFRRHQLGAALAPGAIFIDGRFIAQIGISEFAAAPVSPGRHDLTCLMGVMSGGATIDAPAGTILYLRIGTESGRVTFEQIPGPKARETLAARRFVPSPP